MLVINYSPDALSTMYTVLSNSIDVVETVDYSSSSVQKTIFGRDCRPGCICKVCGSPQQPTFERRPSTHRPTNGSIQYWSEIYQCHLLLLWKCILRDASIEADIIAKDSVDQVLDCRHYNHTITALKFEHEAMWRLRWKAFITWRDNENIAEFHELMQSV